MSVNMKWVSLALLVAQNTTLVLLMRYSLTSGSYSTAAAVAVMELVKLISSTAMALREQRSALRTKSLIQDLKVLYKTSVLDVPNEIVKLAVPSLLYTLQNNLLYLALARLDAATYQVCYQLKILTTALFSVTLLKKPLSVAQWGSLLMLTVGVALAQDSGKKGSGSVKISVENSLSDQALGMFAILAACFTSGFAGVYFEKILKHSKASIWTRNIQMGLTATCIAFGSILVVDFDTVASEGFFRGFNLTVIMVILLQAVGGLLVAIVVKYADNILKG